MKRIALISLHTPTQTNFRGASALPYHLMAFRPVNVEIEIWSYNLNGCSPGQIAETERDLNVKIHIIKTPGKMRLLGNAAVRLLLPKPILAYLGLSQASYKEIADYLNPEDSALWIYGEDIARLALKFETKKTVITNPDCEAMYYHRVLAMKGVPTSAMSLLRYGLMYHRYASMARRYPTGPHIRYHLVGKEDRRFLNRLNPAADARFIRHPHYDFSEQAHAEVPEGEKLRILIAGRYDMTMARAVDEALSAMRTLPLNIKDRYKVTFLGKGWEVPARELQEAGFETETKGYVEDYAAEVSSHHIQLTPVSVGTGTKGKVLDAFANGLMVIGTPLALENVAVESGRECVEYSDGDELASWLIRLANSPSTVNRIAKAGREAILREHGRAKVAEEFFQLFR